MATITPTTNAGAEAPDTGTLVAGILRDFEKLMEQQWEMARVEIRTEYRQAKRAAYLFFAAGGVALVAVILLFLALAQGLTATGMGLAGAYLVSCLVAVAVAAGLFLGGRSVIGEANVLPDRTVKSLTKGEQP